MNVEYAKTERRTNVAMQPREIAGGAVYELITAAYNRAIALLLLVMMAPLWALIAMAIKADTRGPVLFCLPIIGRNGRVFTYYKFRTMRTGEDDAGHREWIRAFVQNDRPYARDAEGNAVFKLIEDPRVTRVGRWLRKVSLDEAPQLINVLRGEMNLVGPRPPVPYEYALYASYERKRLAVKPGITGLYQVSKRGRASFSEMLALDLEYARRRSFWLDLRIMLRTPLAIAQGEVSKP
jgi:lipopolysaccharide/colanic/teichoic acid biosynthesis glycosyltransferase